MYCILYWPLIIVFVSSQTATQSMVNLTLKHKEFEKAQAERRRGLLEEVDARQVWPLVQNRHVFESVWGVSQWKIRILIVDQNYTFIRELNVPSHHVV